MASIVAAAIQAICSPFSPLRRNRDNINNIDEAGETLAAVPTSTTTTTTTMTTTTTTTSTTAITTPSRTATLLTPPSRKRARASTHNSTLSSSTAKTRGRQARTPTSKTPPSTARKRRARTPPRSATKRARASSQGSGGGRKKKSKGTNKKKKKNQPAAEEDDDDSTSSETSKTCWGTLKREKRMKMSDDDLMVYYQNTLEDKTECPNPSCNCLEVLKSIDVRVPVAKYLAWFDRKSKYDQDCTIMDWYKYSHAQGGRSTMYILPYAAESDSMDPITEQKLRSANICRQGLLKVMHIGKARLNAIGEKSKYGIMPVHKLKGKKSYNSLKEDEQRAKDLKDHFEYLLQLGEVRATRVIATLVDGQLGRSNRDDTEENIYLPISMGYRNGYRCYMLNLGYDISCAPNGAVVVKGIDGKVVNPKEFVWALRLEYCYLCSW